MELITRELREIAEKIRVFAVATSSKDGEPNVVAITFVKILSAEEILVMDNFMDKTKKNLVENPRIAISFWYIDPETKAAQAYQLKGNARFETSGNYFDEGVRWVKNVKPEITPNAAIIVKVTEVFNLEPRH